MFTFLPTRPLLGTIPATLASTPFQTRHDTKTKLGYTRRVADVFTKRKRSQVMAAIRSRGNKDTELKLASILRAARIIGWHRHQRLPGKPDFFFPPERLTPVADGCFWHRRT